MSAVQCLIGIGFIISARYFLLLELQVRLSIAVDINTIIIIFYAFQLFLWYFKIYWLLFLILLSVGFVSVLYVHRIHCACLRVLQINGGGDKNSKKIITINKSRERMNEAIFIFAFMEHNKIITIAKATGNV